MQANVITYSPERNEEVLDLLNACLGEKAFFQRDHHYWSWKHEQNPFGPSILLMAESGGRIVGLRAFLRWRFLAGSRTLDVAKPVDTVTHPDWRRRGIFTRLTTDAMEMARRGGVQLLFNTPNRFSLPGYLKMGWRHVGGLPVYVKFTRPASAIAHALSGKGTRGRELDLDRFVDSQASEAQDILEDEASVRELLHARAARTEQLETERTVHFLRWRYGQHPHVPYFAEVSRSNGQIGGILFYRAGVRLGMREILVDDALVRDDRPDVLAALLQQLKARVRADYIVAQPPNPAGAMRAFREAGFRRVFGKNIRLVARAISNDQTPELTTPKLMDQRNWSLCFGDMEGL